jgi:cation:H+ antiporter
VDSLKALAVSAGISEFVFIQWVAPFLSEFPEKVSAFKWAMTVRQAPMALMNLVSSNINQWTVLAAMIPMVYSVSLGGVHVIAFDGMQRQEILLTILQSLLGMLLLVNMRYSTWEAVALFVLWFVQFLMPGLRAAILYVYGALVVVGLVQMLEGGRSTKAFKAFRYHFVKYVLEREPEWTKNAR